MKQTITNIAREQAKIDMEQAFIDAIAYSSIKLTREEINACLDYAYKEAK